MKFMKKKKILSCVSSLTLTLSALMVAMPLVAKPPEGKPPEAKPPEVKPVDVQLIDRDGKNIGSAQFTQEEAGVKIQIQVSGLSAGKHGLHIHSVGACEPPNFKSAGPHFSTKKHKHGFLDVSGPHEGDLPMLDVSSDGRVTDYEFITTRVSLSKDSLRQPQGSSLIIHDKPDDYLTDTGGGSGDRIACGIIQPAGEKQKRAGEKKK